MIKNILNEFRNIIAESDWMDTESRQAARDKLNAIDYKIGYSDIILNDTALENMYKGVSSTFFESFKFY